MTRDGGSRYPPKNDDIIYERPLIQTRTFMDVSKLRKHVQIHSRSHSRDEMPAALRRQESQRSRISLGPPTSLFNLSQKKKRPPGNKKQQITVSQTCRFLESNDYPVYFANHSSEFLADLPPSPTSTCLWWPASTPKGAGSSWRPWCTPSGLNLASNPWQSRAILNNPRQSWRLRHQQLLLKLTLHSLQNQKETKSN